MTPSMILLTGGTGKTGRRIADRLRTAGVNVRTASRSGADVRFDWYDRSTWTAALNGIDALYLVPPSGDTGFAPLVSEFVDEAVRRSVEHFTFLSARGVEHAPPEVPLRAVEIDLEARAGITTSILRPGWFFQNFSEYIWAPGIVSEGVIKAPTGDGAEAFVHADDIADVAVATLLDPDAHAGAGYTLAGPEALTMAQVAAGLTEAIGRPVVHADVDPEEWVDYLVSTGVPTEYAQTLTFVIANFAASANAATTDTIREVTGREPRSFAHYLAEPATRDALTPAAV